MSIELDPGRWALSRQEERRALERKNRFESWFDRFCDSWRLADDESIFGELFGFWCEDQEYEYLQQHERVAALDRHDEKMPEDTRPTFISLWDYVVACLTGSSVKVR